MASHSFLPPSGASAWSQCALWCSMNARYPESDTLASAEGTAAHWVNTEMLAGRTPAEGTLAPNGEIVSEEMLDGGEMYCDVVARMLADLPLHIEERVDIPTIHETCFGTPDTWGYHAGTMHLKIVDYKFGHGFVDEFFNAQGLSYALGILSKLAPTILGDLKYVTVSFTIVQPRCFYRGLPVRTHTYTIAEAAEKIAKLRQAALNAMAPNPPATTGEHCEHCPGRHSCSALQLAAGKAADLAIQSNVTELSPQAAGLELWMLEKALGKLQARVEGLKEQTLANMKAGAAVPLYKLEPGKGRAQWNIPVNQVIAIGNLLGKDLSKVTVITPNQAKKIIDASVISAYSSITSGAQNLVPENNADVRKVFG